MMRFFQWIAWVFSHEFLAINFFVSGFLIIVGVNAWQERDFTYAIIPFILAAAVTVFFLYKQTTELKTTPCLGVKKVICVDTTKNGRLNTITGRVILKETIPGTVFIVNLYTYSVVESHSSLSAIIESVRTIKVRSGGFDMSWSELSIPGECRTPYGIITFKEIKPV